MRAMVLGLTLIASVANAEATGETKAPPSVNSVLHGSLVSEDVKSLRVVRLYTGDDGHSHFDVSWQEGKRDSMVQVDRVEGDHPIVKFFDTPAKYLRIFNSTANLRAPFHNTPRANPEMFFIVRGYLDLDVHDGTVFRADPGTLMVIDDSTGSGHGASTGPDGYTAIWITLGE